jgi:hypothetical protein
VENDDQCGGETKDAELTAYRSKPYALLVTARLLIFCEVTYGLVEFGESRQAAETPYNGDSFLSPRDAGLR